MRYVTAEGKTIQELSFKCGRCKNVVPCSLVFVDGGPPPPHDIPLHCGGCYAFVAMINPSGAERDFMAETAHLEGKVLGSEPPPPLAADSSERPQ